jgi:hypothetical protein
MAPLLLLLLLLEETPPASSMQLHQLLSVAAGRQRSWRRLAKC